MRDAAEFLIKPAREGYPTDYLLSRIRSRRSELTGLRGAAEGAALPSPPQGRAWMRQEFRWVYLQMNRRMRGEFAPFFLWFELRTVLVGLRHLRAADREQVARTLDHTLLGDRVQGAFTSAHPPFAPSGPLAELAGADPRQAADLERWYLEQKGLEYEQRFAYLYLKRLTGQGPHTVVRDFFTMLVDMKNLVAVAKQLRWRGAEPTLLFAGGSVPEKTLAKVLKQRDEAALRRLLPRFAAPAPPEASPESVEHALLAHLTRQVRRGAADRLGCGSILAYLWEIYLEARNTAVAFHAGGGGADLLARELVP